MKSKYPKNLSYPYLGFGLGLRTDHYHDILNTLPKIDWFEVLTENYLVPGGKPLHYLDQIKEHYPMVMHGVSMSIGSTDPLDFKYLQQVKDLAKRINAYWISDHLCWTGVHGKNMHDLLPLPYTEEALKHTAKKIIQAQDFLEQQILIENPSTYLNFKHSTMNEYEFLIELCNESDCLILLDINNIYVSAFNHGFSAEDYLQAVPVERVKQFHLAGHTNHGTHIIDTHDAAVISPVWQLLKNAYMRFGKVSTMIERDDHIPPLNELLEELEQAKHIAAEVFVEAAEAV